MGSLLEYVKMAIKNIKSNKGRSFLTMLGIIIGISSVIMIVSLGGGFAKSMSSELNSLGGGLIQLTVGDKGNQEGLDITKDDLEALKEVDGIVDVIPYIMNSGNTETGKGEFDVHLTPMSEEAGNRGLNELKTGRKITEDDVENHARVANILDTDAIKLFGSADVLDMTVDVKNQDGTVETFTIVGVLKSKDTSKLIGGSFDGMPISLSVPWTVVDEGSVMEGRYYMVTIYADKAKDQKIISDTALKTLESRYQVESGKDYFNINSFQDTLKQINQTMGMMTTFVAFVGAVSLLVGGIGVMNIMLVSVTERTREIGIRKSLGAKTSSIMVQFLAESAILTIIGGFIGIVIGILGAMGIGSVLGASLNMKLVPDVSIQAVLGATLFSTAVGVFFGLYPAKKAAKLNPIEALRRE